MQTTTVNRRRRSGVKPVRTPPDPTTDLRVIKTTENLIVENINQSIGSNNNVSEKITSDCLVSFFERLCDIPNYDMTNYNKKKNQKHCVLYSIPLLFMLTCVVLTIIWQVLAASLVAGFCFSLIFYLGFQNKIETNSKLIHSKRLQFIKLRIDVFNEEVLNEKKLQLEIDHEAKWYLLSIQDLSLMTQNDLIPFLSCKHKLDSSTIKVEIELENAYQFPPEPIQQPYAEPTDENYSPRKQDQELTNIQPVLPNLNPGVDGVKQKCYHINQELVFEANNSPKKTKIDILYVKRSGKKNTQPKVSFREIKKGI